MNRTRLRRRIGIEGSIWTDVLLYSIHVCNSCLVLQEQKAHGKWQRH